MIAVVVPTVPSYSLDGGFRYAVPERLEARIAVGSMVRVPLGGRRVGGFVIAVEDGEPTGLRDLAAVSGAAPVFDRTGLEVCRWAARHYVAPLSVMLARTAPPNVPPGRTASPDDPVPDQAPHPLRRVVSEAAGGRSHRTTVWLDAGDPGEWLGPVAAEALSAGRSVMVVAPTAGEAGAAAERLRAFGHRLVEVSSDDAAAVTAAWGRAAHHGGVLVGTPRVAMWPVAGLGVIVVLEESRRAMKDRQTPTVHVRDVVLARARRSGLAAIFAGPTPSLELMARAPEVMRPGHRIWPLVEVVDRREEAPGPGMLSERAKQAIRVTVSRRGRVFVFAHRHGYSAASRCSSCRESRRCPSCGSRPDPGPSCSRCGQVLGPCGSCGGTRFEPLGAGVGRVLEDVRRIVDRELVGEHPADLPVTVGTERDLVALPPCDLTLMVDADGLVFGANYRAAEEALRIGARLAGTVRPGQGNRLLVQTQEPDHPVMVALRRADPTAFSEPEMAIRRQLGYPPAGSLIVVELRGDAADAADAAIREAAADNMVMGPVPGRTGTRWLIQGRDLDRVRVDLRPTVQRWRDSGLTVRVDVDPIDL